METAETPGSKLPRFSIIRIHSAFDWSDSKMIFEDGIDVPSACAKATVAWMPTASLHDIKHFYLPLIRASCWNPLFSVGGLFTSKIMRIVKLIKSYVFPFLSPAVCHAGWSIFFRLRCEEITWREDSWKWLTHSAPASWDHESQTEEFLCGNIRMTRRWGGCEWCQMKELSILEEFLQLWFQTRFGSCTLKFNAIWPKNH